MIRAAVSNTAGPSRRVLQSALTLGVLWSPLLVATAAAQAPSRTRIEVVVFPGGFNWPLWAADHKGFFAREGLDVTLTPTVSSAFQIANVAGGKFDIAMTAVDNVVACREGQVEGVSASACDLFAFMGGDSGLLSLVVQPEIASYGELRGKSLSVDAPTTGYAFVLRAMLERAGLNEGDYTLTPAGGVLQRWEALQARAHAGTLLLTPFELMAESAGFRRLANALDVLGSYQGLVGAARRSWAATHRTALVGFIRAYRAGLAWLFDRANRPEALALLQKFVPGMSPALATRAYDVLLAPAGGFHPSGAIDLKGVETVLQLRGRYATPPASLADPARYYDASYYEQASQPR